MKVNQEKIQEAWYIVDAKGKRMGLVASKVAELLLGKNNPLIKPHVVPQNKVIVVNADKIDYTPKRGYTKFYKRYSGYPSGQSVESLDELIKRRPTAPLEKAIKGMLPKNTRGREIFNNLFIYAQETHNHEAQKPQAVDITKATF